MVSLPLLIALLTLIDVTRSFEYFIDLKRCKTKEMACYVRNSCIESTTPGDPNKLDSIVNDKLNGDTCDVIVQIKAFTKFKYFMMIQVNISANESSLDELDTNAGISIVHVETQAKCSSNGIDGKLVKEKYGSRQLSTKTIIFCSAILAVTDVNPNDKKPIAPIFEENPYLKVAPALEISYLNKEKEVLQYTVQGDDFWTVKDKCSDELLHTSNKENNGYLFSEIDVTPAVLSCPEPQQIFVDYPREEMVMNSAVWCNNVAWLYKKNGNDIQVDKGQAFSVYCAIKFSELCTHSAPFLIKDCRGCSPPTPIGNDTFKCDGNKWRMSDGSVEETEVKCKRIGNERTSAWQTNKGKIITEGACSADFNCATFNNFTFTVPMKDEVHVYKAVDQIGDGNRLNCSEGFNLSYISSDGATKIIEKDLVCNTENGFFYPEGHKKEQDKQANNTSSVYCAKKHGEVIEKDNPENAQPATGAMSSTTIAASIGGTFAVLLIVGGIIGFILFRRSKRIEEEKALEEKKRNTLSTCREIDIYKEVLRQKDNKWIIDEIPEKERRIRDKIRNKLIEFEPLDYHVIGDEKAVDNDLVPRAGEFDHWTGFEFVHFVFFKFHRYTFDQRIICLRAVTAFISFTEADDWKGKPKKNFGTINQFFDILKMSQTHKVKDFEVWEHLFRMCIRFYASCTDSHAVNPKRRFRDLWKEIAKSMLDNLGGKKVPKENYHMTGIRRIALRIMLWLKDKKWTMFIAEEAKKPLRSIAEEIRPVVLQYAVREGGREDEIKKEFYDEVKREEWEPWQGVKHGIYRHHLIYALCSAKDKPDEEGRKNLYTTTREIVDAIFKDPKDLNRIFTPKDIYWAFKGATEDPEAAVYSVDMFSTNMCSYSADDCEAWIDVIIRRTEGLEDKRERMLGRLKAELIATLQLVGESCTSDALFNELKDAWKGCVKYAVPEGAHRDVFNVEMLEQRVHNVRFLCDNEKLSKMIVTGMEQSGFRLAPTDGGD